MPQDLTYPLAWPQGWARTKNPARSKFNSLTMPQAYNEVRESVERFGGSNLIISSNVIGAQQPIDMRSLVDYLPSKFVDNGIEHSTAVSRVESNPPMMHLPDRSPFEEYGIVSTEDCLQPCWWIDV